MLINKLTQLMTFVFRHSLVLTTTVTLLSDDSYGNIFPIPSMKNWNQSEPELTVYRTRTEYENISNTQNKNRIEPLSPKNPYSTRTEFSLSHVY